MLSATIVGMLAFIGKKNFMLSLVEHEISFITLGPDNSQLGTLTIGPCQSF